jgi:hypothetical protein
MTLINQKEWLAVAGFEFTTANLLLQGFSIGGIHGKFPVVIFAFEMGLCLVYQCHLCKSVVRFIPFGLLSAFIRANQR